MVTNADRRPAMTPPAPLTAPRHRALSTQYLLLAGLAVVHIGLGFVLRPMPVVAVSHAIGCAVVGVVVALRRPLADVAVPVSYIAGSEVLWRMTRTPIFWEFGKYAITLVLLVALLRLRAPRNRALAIGYFLLLAPSCVLTFFALDTVGARQQLSFNLSGPLTLALCVLVFSNIRMTALEVRNAMYALILPVIGIATVAYTSIASTKIEFIAASNSALSGGFGPNQVSAMLGLAVVFCLLLLVERKLPLGVQLALILVAVIFSAQAALTFSRGGILLALASLMVAGLYLARERRTRVTLVVMSIVLAVVANIWVVPRLDEFTSGKLAERYSSIDPTGRGLLAGFDLQIFADNPVLGVGPGVATPLRGELGHFGAAHTEYTRMLAEHGMLGAFAIFLLVVLAIRVAKACSTLKSRAFVLAMITWAALFLAVNAMRLAAPALTAGLACAIAYSSRTRRGDAL